MVCSQSTISDVTTTTDTNTTNHVYSKLAPEDYSLMYRLVGYYEYIKALENFDRLLAMCSPTEIDVIDELVKERDEFAVYTNLSRRLQRAQSTLTERPQKPDDSFERRGFAWVVALARTEVAAIIGGFTHMPAPFESVRPTKYEMAAYRELLQDGARTHYWALVNDPALKKLLRAVPDHRTVAYVRRLTVALEFLHAAAKVDANHYTQIQFAELKKWNNDLEEVRLSLLANIQSFLSGGSYQTASSKTEEQQFETFSNCAKQLSKTPLSNVQITKPVSPGNNRSTP